MPILRHLSFEYTKMPPYILMRVYFEFLRAIPLQRVGCIRVTHPSATLSTFRYLPFDLHVLGLPLAFILSQDQTLLCIFLFLSFFPVLGSIFGINFSLSFLTSQTSWLIFSKNFFASDFPSLSSFLSVFSECKITPFFFLYNTFLNFFLFIFIPIDYHYFIPCSTLTPTPVFASSCPLPPLFLPLSYTVSTPFFYLPPFHLFSASSFYHLLFLILYLINKVQNFHQDIS